MPGEPLASAAVAQRVPGLAERSRSGVWLKPIGLRNWPEEFYAGGEPEKRRYHLETKPGGRMYESWEGGGGDEPTAPST